MSQGDDGAPKRPANGNVPRPGAPGRAKAPPPVPTAAKVPPPPAPEANPFLAPESSRDVDAGWLAMEDVEEASLAPPPPEAPPPPIPPPPPIAKVEPTEPVVVVEEPEKPRSVGDSPSPPASLPARKRSRAKVLAFVLFPGLLLAGGGLVYQAQMNARASRLEPAAPPSTADATGSIEPPAPAAEPPPPPTHAPDPPPSASASNKKPAAGGAAAAAAVSADPAKQGILDTTSLPAGRKIVVDGRVVGTSPRRVAVRCGVHRIQIGDLPPESLELPCGGEISFTD